MPLASTMFVLLLVATNANIIRDGTQGYVYRLRDIAYEDIIIHELPVPALKGFARLALGSEYRLPTTKESLIRVVDGIDTKAFSSEARAALAVLAEEAVRSYMTYILYAPKKNKEETGDIKH